MVPPANEIIEIEDTVPYGDDAQQTLDLPNPEGAAVEAARLAAEKEKQEATPQDIFMKGPLVDLEESSKVCVTGLSGVWFVGVARNSGVSAVFLVVRLKGQGSLRSKPFSAPECKQPRFVGESSWA